MFKKILVALENTEVDKSLIPHIIELAKSHGSDLLLLHVADGWTARNYDELNLKESEEMKIDRKYLEQTAHKMRKEGLQVEARLALGEPPEEILKVAEKEGCDLIAMTSHGHRFWGDLFFGSTIEKVRHQTEIPLFIVRKGH